MRYHHVLVTGGAGFVGSSLAIFLKDGFPNCQVTAFDNLRRRGSEVNISRLRERGVHFAHGDVRSFDDLAGAAEEVDLIIDCSAEPSVLAGSNGDVRYVVDTNLGGTVNCLELARQRRADFLFLSTSRVYPIALLNEIEVREGQTRFEISSVQNLPGITQTGISEDFPLTGRRSLYGATKLCSELLIQEYAEQFGVKCVVNRCGVITGPWQMGKVDQGVIALWVARHYLGHPLSYNGFGGQGKQVRDLLHIDDLLRLVAIQLENFSKFTDNVFNVGGGLGCSLSLQETTTLCQEITGRTVPIQSVPDSHNADIKLYVTDNARVTTATGWSPQHTPASTLASIHEWLQENDRLVRTLFAA
jgi:CDP-paratose 2-epimerase